MRFRTFLSVLFLFGLAIAFVALLQPNRTLLEETMQVFGRPVPIWGVILGAFTLGVSIGVFFQLTGAGRGAISQLMSRWSNRHQQAAQRALDRGLQAEREDRLADAVTAYRDAVDLQPTDYSAQMHLGDVLRRSGRAIDAVTFHERARRLEPTNGEPRHALALDHLAMGNVDAARRELHALIDANPRGAIGPLRQLRDLEMSAGHWSAADQAARRLLSLTEKSKGPSPGDQRQALGIRTELARARGAKGQLRSAMGIARKVIKEAASFTPARLVQAELHALAGEISEARDTLIDGFRETGEPALLDALAALDLQRERPEDAISTLRGLIAGGAHQSAARLALGKLYLRLEMLDDAVQRFEQIYESEGRPPIVAVLLARAEERRGNTKRAAALLRGVLDEGERAHPQAICDVCRHGSKEWAQRCTACGSFGSLHTRVTVEETVRRGVMPLPPS